MDKAKLKKIATTGLKVLKNAVDIASKFFPPVGVIGSLIDAVLGVFEKTQSITDVQKHFQVISQGLDELSQQNQKVMEDIGKATTDRQFKDVRFSLNYQFKKYKEMIDAPPEEVEKRTQEFVECYEEAQGRQHLYTLYESVIGVSKVFSQPILQVYQQHSGTDRETMINLSQELFSLFSIGCITMMAHGVIIKDDVEGRAKEWEEKMVEVTSAIEKAVGEFK
ncbi:protein rapunzel [Oryzias melastigma]|uniref:protein rapunzel n=1 Tax=Oryzias melastigma TaxID=30732 RepID=UPI000CF7C694|nr:protein rapunzel [Oryzias melastigma]